MLVSALPSLVDRPALAPPLCGEEDSQAAAQPQGRLSSGSDRNLSTRHQPSRSNLEGGVVSPKTSLRVAPAVETPPASGRLGGPGRRTPQPATRLGGSKSRPHPPSAGGRKEEGFSALGVGLPERSFSPDLLLQPPKLTQGVAFALRCASDRPKNQVQRPCHRLSIELKGWRLPPSRSVSLQCHVSLTWCHPAHPSRAGKFCVKNRRTPPR